MICNLRISICIIGMFFSSSIVFGQYQSKTIDISKTITSLNSLDNSYLLYGTKSGEIGLYDGLLLDRKHNFGSAINNIKVVDGREIVLTAEGLYKKENERYTLISPNTLNVLDVSEDLSTLITTAGIYSKSGSDYLPNSEEFYNTNEIAKGKFFNLDKHEYLWIDRNIYVNRRSWKEAILHPKTDMDVISLSNSLIISDHNGLVSYEKNETIDTLLRIDSVGISKIFPISNSQILYCADNQAGVFDLRKRELTNIREINTQLINAVTIDDWDNIRISAGSYLYQISETKSQASHAAPILAMNTVKVNGVAQEIGQSISFDKGNNDIEISYDGIHLSNPQDLVYQTKLSVSNNLSTGIQNVNTWVNQGKKKEAEYRNLPAGKYKFQVRATVGGEYHTYSKKLDIRVNDNSVQYYWLAGLLGAAGIFFTAMFFNSRYNRLKVKSDQERKLLIQENKMLSLQQKALQLQMNPHFVFNALNSIQGLIAKEDNKNARRYLQQFSSMMRSVLDQSRKETISLEEEVTYLKSYLSLEQMANNDSFDYQITIDADVEDGIDIPTMIVQPFIENSIIHGVKGLKERRGMIMVSFVQEGSKLRCSIEDNGIGRKSAAKNKKSSHKSVALDVVNERLRNKGDRRNPVTYIDLKGEKDSEVGTLVEVIMPIS